MALSSSSARLASSPVNFRNPGAGGWASFGDVVWAVAGGPESCDPQADQQPQPEYDAKRFHDGPVSRSGFPA